jgi:septum formation protein
MSETPLLLASKSQIRLTLLQNAGLSVTALPARIDETAVRMSLQADNASPRDIADTLAEMKARKIAERHPAALVLGCDQVLAHNDQVFAKPTSLDDARDQLCRLRNSEHRLHSAVVLYHQAQPIWRHIGTATLTMRDFSDAYSVGAYQLEHEGVRLFSSVVGDYFTILGLPLLPLLSYLTLRGFIPS